MLNPIAPYLDQLIPSCADNHRILRVGAESHTRHPLGMTLIRDGKLAVAKRVPQLDRSVPRARDDLTIISRKGNGQDVVGMADEPTGRNTRGEFPEAKSLIP